MTELPRPRGSTNTRRCDNTPGTIWENENLQRPYELSKLYRWVSKSLHREELAKKLCTCFFQKCHQHFSYLHCMKVNRYFDDFLWTLRVRRDPLVILASNQWPWGIMLGDPDGPTPWGDGSLLLGIALMFQAQIRG